MSIKEILEDLYKLDPALRSEEAELKEIIEKLLAQKPDAEADEDFKIRLKEELLSGAERKKKRAGFFLVHRKEVIRAAGLAAAVVAVLTFSVRSELITDIMNPVKMELEETAMAPVPLPSAEAESTLADAVDIDEERVLTADAPMMKRSLAPASEHFFDDGPDQDLVSTEEYREITGNGFILTAEQPVSTFSIDVDTASYSNVRRFITSGALPDPDAVRIEELINYFSYDYPEPDGDQPFSISTEYSACPWNENNRLLHIGLQGWDIDPAELPPANLVFLLDSSGSMQDENKLPLLKDSLSLLIETLRPEDRVSIVAYAGSAGLVLPPTAGNLKSKILQAVDRLEAGGSTAGGEGLELVYHTAAENFFPDGNNRVILATDGDFNVGQSSEEELTDFIEKKRDEGISLTVLGLGMGNYKDARMEALADNGNGNYSYIDTINEANKVLITELSSTMLTIAKDVKIQVVFNKSAVGSYRLIGYENRHLTAADFNDDMKDAGDIGAGHSVTALYEIIPAAGSLRAENLAEIRFRYKKPEEDQSRLITSTVDNVVRPLSEASDNFIFSAAVAEWGMLLRGSEYAADSDISRLRLQASEAAGDDRFGYRAEFIGLIEETEKLLD